MTTETIGVRAATLATRLLDQATEFKFFLQFLCLFLYIEIGTSVVLGAPFIELTWVTLQQLTIGKLFIGIILYFGAMSYLLKIPYIMILYIGNTRIAYFFTNYNNKYDEGYFSQRVHYQKALTKAYEAKDKELKKEVDEHMERCKERNNENKEAGILAFSSIFLGCIDFFLIRNSFLLEGYNALITVMPQDLATIIVLLLLFPFLLLIHTSMKSTYDADFYLYHPALHRELEADKKENKSTVLRRVG